MADEKPAAASGTVVLGGAVKLEGEKPGTVKLGGTIELDKVPQPSMPPKTTEQEDITLAGQRRINLIWEYTQAAVAVSVTFAIIYTAIMKIDSVTLTNAFFLIIGFYYSRTNHAAIGGVGPKATDNQRWEGR